MGNIDAHALNLNVRLSEDRTTGRKISGVVMSIKHILSMVITFGTALYRRYYVMVESYLGLRFSGRNSEKKNLNIAP
jgi:hypothetical protein